MKVVALVSGGKDSTYNMMQCIAAGHTIVALANLVPKQRTENNSYMYQSVGFEAIDYIAEAMEVPLFKVETGGLSVQQGNTYEPTDDDEVEDLYKLLKTVQENVEVQGVSCGAILSNYQRVRVENVCVRLGLVSLAYLWQRKQEELLKEMIKCEIDAIIIKVAALGLDPQRHLGRSLRLLEPHLLAMHEKYGLNVCGEGGEYETLTLDCPLYKQRIIIEESEIVIDSNDVIAPVGFLKINKLKLELKLPQLDLDGRFNGLDIKDCDGYVTDMAEEATESNDEDDVSEESVEDKVGGLEDINQACNYSKSGKGWLFIGGITGNSSENIEENFKAAMAKLKLCLESNDQTFQDISSISMYIGDMSQYAEINKLYCTILNHVNPPTRACVQVPLPKHCPFIIEAIASKLQVSATTEPRTERHTMHVQSVSHWCPANIGPYSQGVKIENFIQLAGQIALIPGSLQMVKGGIKSECRLSLRHVERLLRGLDTNCDLRDVVQGICYLADLKYVKHARKLWEEKTNNAIVDYVVVSTLPRNALVEWHVWAHTHNHQFEYEETGQCMQDWSISIYRRWNYENSTAAIVCHVDSAETNTVLSTAIFRETIEYVLQKLNQSHDYDPNSVCNLKVFYPVKKNVCAYSFVSVLEEFRKNIPLVHTIVPVVSLNNKNTFLSICGTRMQ